MQKQTTIQSVIKEGYGKFPTFSMILNGGLVVRETKLSVRMFCNRQLLSISVAKSTVKILFSSNRQGMRGRETILYFYIGLSLSTSQLSSVIMSLNLSPSLSSACSEIFSGLINQVFLSRRSSNVGFFNAFNFP